MGFSRCGWVLGLLWTVGSFVGHPIDGLDCRDIGRDHLWRNDGRMDGPSKRIETSSMDDWDLLVWTILSGARRFNS